MLIRPFLWALTLLSEKMQFLEVTVLPGAMEVRRERYVVPPSEKVTVQLGTQHTCFNLELVEWNSEVKKVPVIGKCLIDPGFVPF